MNSGPLRSSHEASERRFLTIEFIDLVGSTDLAERLDPEDLGPLLRRYQRLALTVMERFGGFVAQVFGDGILVYFGYPTAHEHDAERAARAALALLQQLRDLDTNVHGRTLPKLEARIGIHSGLVLIAQELLASTGTSRHDVVGEAINLAARLQAEAPPGGIAISQETMELVEGLFACRSLGVRSIKGLSRKLEVYAAHARLARHEADRVPPAPRRDAHGGAGGLPSSGFCACWNIVKDESRCQTLAVVGDAGVGKTRLVLELSEPARVRRCDTGAGAMPRDFRQHAALSASEPIPVGTRRADRRRRRARALRQDFELSRGTGPQHCRRTGVSSRVFSAWPPRSAAARPRTTATAQARTIRIHRFDRQAGGTRAAGDPLGRRRALAGPVIGRTSAGHRDRFGTIARSGGADDAAVSQGTCSSLQIDETVRLEHLGMEDCLEVARSVPGASVLSDEMISKAVAAADGVPFFLEQLVISLIEEQSQGPAPHRRLGGVPLMLAELMSERLDRRPGARRIAQAAACIGGSFTRDFLLTLLKDETRHRFRSGWKRWSRRRFCVPRRYGAEVRYEFRHGLLQRMAHESMLHAERRRMHRLGSPKCCRKRRGRNRRSWKRSRITSPKLARSTEAIGAWLRAGLSAAKRSAHLEAIAHIRRGLGLLDQIADRECAAAARAESAGFADGFAAGDAKRHLVGVGGLLRPWPRVVRGRRGRRRSCSRSRSGSSPSSIAAVGAARRFRWRLSSSRAPSAKDSSRSRSSGIACWARRFWPRATPQRRRRHSSGRWRSTFLSGTTTATHKYGQNTEVHTKSLLSLTQFCLGDVDAALEVGLDALQTADALRHPHSTAIPMVYVGGWVFGLCEATEQMMTEARNLLALAEQHRLNGFRAHAAAFVGWALCQGGNPGQGIPMIAKAIAAFDSVQFRLAEAGHLANLADAQRRVGPAHRRGGDMRTCHAADARRQPMARTGTAPRAGGDRGRSRAG